MIRRAARWAAVTWIVLSLVLCWLPTDLQRPLRTPSAGAAARSRPARTDESSRHDARSIDVGVNALMLMPLGALVVVGWPRRRRILLAVAVCVALSATIELGQLLVVQSRQASWRDLGWNVAGGLAAAAVAALLDRRPAPAS